MNIGSNSFKFQIIDMATEGQIFSGYTKHVGSNQSVINYFIGSQT